MNLNIEAGRGDSLTLKTLRADIDQVDWQIIELLGKRAQLVRRLGEIKKGTPVHDPDREREVLAKVKGAALEKGLDPDFVEDVYRTLFTYYIKLQQENRLLDTDTCP